MNIRDTIAQEITALRAKGAALVQAAQNDAAHFEAQAAALEQKLGSIPGEIEALADEAVERVWAWLKGI